MSKKNVVELAISVIVALTIIVGIFFHFSKEIEIQLFNVGSENVEETYREVGQLFNELSESRWNYLTLLGEYFENGNVSEEEYKQTISEFKETCKFTEFYLLDDSGKYMTIDGEDGYIDLGSDLSSVMVDGNKTMIDGSLPKKDNMIFYVVKTDTNTFNGFEYDALAFGYNSFDMAESLEIEAYNGTSYPYVVYKSGRIAIATEKASGNYSNILSLLKELNVGDEVYNQVKEDFQNAKTGTIEVTRDNQKYYFTYQPLGIQDWMLVSFTPVQAVNRSIDNIRSNTTLMITLSVGLLGLVTLAGVGFYYIKSMHSKNQQIEQRDTVFTLISNDLDEIYLLYDYNTMRIEYISPNVTRLLGLTPDEIYDNPNSFNKVWPERTKDIKEVLNAIQTKQSLEKEIYLKGLNSKHETLYNVTVFTPKDDDEGVAVISDRSKERKVRQEIEDALAAAEQANRAKTAFLSNVSHDIRTPMNAIVGFSTLAEKEISNKDKVKNYLRKIQDSSHHLLNLINDVLDFSKIEAGKTTLTTEAENVETIVNRLDSMLRPQTIEKKQNFIFDTKCDTQCIVDVDELRLTQILVNILSNSIKYTPEGGTISLKMSNEVENHMVRYTFIVSDTGVGMSEEFLKTVFDPFSREIKSTTNKIQGTGLGMAITKNLVDLMGGTITVESKKDVGTTFIVNIGFKLVKLLTNQNDSVIDVEAEEVSIAGLNILIAEDNELNAEIITELLKMEDCNVKIVENGKLAVEEFTNSKEGTYDIILMDVQMPEMNGYEATRKIRSSNHPQAESIPIIAMTANAFNEDKQDAFDAGMNAHVAKPIDMLKLKTTIKEVMGK